MRRFCLECGKEIPETRTKYCNRKCGNNFRQKNHYKDKYTTHYRSLSPRNFMMCLCKKKKERRDLNVDDLMVLWEKQGGMCALTGYPMTHKSGSGRIPTNISIDQIIPQAGYTPDNIRLVCTQANKMKMELSDESLLEWAKSIVKTLEGNDEH